MMLDYIDCRVLVPCGVEYGKVSALHYLVEEVVVCLEMNKAALSISAGQS